MASTYLLTRTFMPLSATAGEAVMDRAIGRPSAALRAMLDATCAKLIRPDSDSLIHHPDASWLDAHVSWLSALSGWQLALLQHSQAHALDRAEQLTARGLLRSAHSIAWLAFAYADAAQAEQLAAALPPGASGLLRIEPSGEKDAQDLMLDRAGFRPMARAWPYLQHPLRQWLEQQAESEIDAPHWSEWELQRLSLQRTEPAVIDRWRGFIRDQRSAALAAATPRSPMRVGSQHFTDGERVWFRALGATEPDILKGADPKTFRTLEDREGFGWYGADAHRLWYCEQALPCDAPQALGPLAVDDRFLTDGCRVYFDGQVLEGIDARGVRAIPGPEPVRGFLQGDTLVVGYGGVNQIPVDGATFRSCGSNYFLDKDGVYELHGTELLVEEGFDSQTFSVLAHGDNVYLRDAHRAALARGEGLPCIELEGAVGSDFTGIPGHPHVTDGKHIWLAGKRCRKLEGKPLPQPSGEARGAKKSAEPMDTGHEPRIVKGRWTLQGAVIEGWQPDRPRTSAIGGFEDDLYRYSCFTGEGGGILVWTREYADFPLLSYELDEARKVWRPPGPVPAATALSDMPRGPLLTDEEHETLFACIPRGEAHELVQMTFEEPAMEVTRWRDSRSFSVRGAVNYGYMRFDAEINESIAPIRTPAACVAIRRALDVIMDSIAPLPYPDFKAALTRVPVKQSLAAFDLDPARAGGRTQVIVQSGKDVQRGIWVDTVREGRILRMSVQEEQNGLLATECWTGPEQRWEQTDNEGFERAHWQVERRRLFRECIALYCWFSIRLASRCAGRRSSSRPGAARHCPG